MRLHLLYVILMFIRATYELATEEGGPTEVKVGAIFFKDEEDLELSFDESFRVVNNLKYFELRFVTIKRYMAEDDSLKLQQLTCELISNGVSAIFGPSSKASSDIVALIANTTRIPHIQFDSKVLETLQIQLNHQMSVNLAPSLSLLAGAMLDIVRDDFEWKTFTLIYETDEGLARLQDVMKILTVSADTIKIRRISDYENDYRVLWKETMEISHETHIILDCHPSLLENLVTLAKSFDLFGPFHSWFFTNLDTHNSPLRSMYDASFRANITAVRLKTADQNPYERKKMRLSRFDELLKNQSMCATLMYDAVMLYANAVRNVISNLNEYEEPRGRCEMNYGDNYPWGIGEEIIRTMKTISEDDIEPPLRLENMIFNEYGERIGFSLEIFKPTVNEPMALWKPNEKIRPIRSRFGAESDFTPTLDFSQQRKMYKVVTHFEEPYFMLKLNHAELRGIEKYEGYAVDLIQKLSEILEFDYDFLIERGNGKYDDQNKKWDGVIGRLIDHQAQIGVCDITITQSRRAVVDFTVPFMQLGIAILYFKSPPEPKDPFAFLDPFSAEVWLSMMLVQLIMTLLFVCIARISYIEWRNPYMTLPDTEEVTNKWYNQNSGWLMVGSIMQQGCDILPRGPPMRILTGAWWFFALMMVSTYTASLAAFLTSNKMQSSIKSLKDLIEQSDVKYGTLSGGSTSLFFSESNNTEYFRAWNQMKSFKPSTFTKSNKEGVARVSSGKGNYAYLMETTSLLYNTERHCNLMQVGPQIGEKHYALAVPLGAPYRTNLSVTILQLGERGDLYKMKNKWWKNKNGSCEAPKADDDGEELSIIELGGVFVVVGVGVVVAIIIGVIEFLWNVQTVAVKEAVTPWQAFKSELNFAWRFWLKRKPMRITEGPHSKSRSHSPRSSRYSRGQSRVSEKASSKASSKSKSM